MSKYTFAEEAQVAPERPVFEPWGDDIQLPPWPFNDTVYTLTQCPCCGDNTLSFDTRVEPSFVKRTGGRPPGLSVEHTQPDGVRIFYFCHTCWALPQLDVIDDGNGAGTVTMQWKRGSR